MTNESTSTKPKSGLATGLAIGAITFGIITFLYGGMLGRSAGWELMAIPTLGTIGMALVSIIVERRALTFASLLGVALAVVGFLMGA